MPYGDEEFYIGLALSQSRVTNTDAPLPENHKVNALTLDINMRTVNFMQGGYRYHYQNKIVGDAFLLAKSVFEDANNIFRAEETMFTTGILGWYDGFWNVNDCNGRYALALGFSAKDYFFGSTYYVDTFDNGNGGFASYDPQGYYFAAEPSVLFDYCLSDWFILEAQSSFNFSFWRPVTTSYAIVDPTSPFPNFGHINVDLISKIGFHLGFNYSWIHNRGLSPIMPKRA